MYARYLLVLFAVFTMPGVVREAMARGAAIDGATVVDRTPRISPDYADTVIPPNIAPLNFVVREPGAACKVVITADKGEQIQVAGREGRIVIPSGPWHALLEANRGGQLRFEVYVRNDSGQWRRFTPIVNTIAVEDINRYLVYRLLKPLYNMWMEMNIYQRDLTGYERRPIWRSRTFHDNRKQGGGCINCHAFAANRTERMAVSYRDGDYGAGALLVIDGEVTNLNTKFGYTAWHPSGRLVAYSRNKVRQFFHSAGTQIRDVIDLDSSLAYYVLKTRTVKSNAKLNDPDRMETYPHWSSDGRYLYFCSAPILWTDRETVPPENWEKVRYDLMRVSYDIDSDTFGELETLLTAEQTGKSILAPRISPDGRFVVFCMTDYGCFPIYQPSSDLYIMDLQAERAGGYEYRALKHINSEHSESWHNWSTEGRWMVFTSKRDNGRFARPYLTYIDGDGKAHKPVIVPQKDPTLYNSLVKSFTVPELIIEPVRSSERALTRAVQSPEKVAVNTSEGDGKSVLPSDAGPWRPGPASGTQ